MRYAVHEMPAPRHIYDASDATLCGYADTMEDASRLAAREGAGTRHGCVILDNVDRVNHYGITVEINATRYAELVAAERKLANALAAAEKLFTIVGTFAEQFVAMSDAIDAATPESLDTANEIAMRSHVECLETLFEAETILNAGA